MSDLDYFWISTDVNHSLAEDIGSGDVSAALLDKNSQVKAEILSREPLFLAGQPWVDAVFKAVDATISLEWQFSEGTWIEAPETLAWITGSALSILTAERCALNFLQTIAATATQTYRYVNALAGTNTQLLDTRKTLPGLRYAQKYAVRAAGGVNHRMGLYDAFLIKENHIKSSGSITKAVTNARNTYPDLFLEVEVETLEQLQEALSLQPDRILLDNFSLSQLEQAVALQQQHSCFVPLEASGNINLKTIQSVAQTGVNFVSVGAITKSIQAVDLSLLIRETQ